MLAFISSHSCANAASCVEQSCQSIQSFVFDCLMQLQYVFDSSDNRGVIQLPACVFFREKRFNLQFLGLSLLLSGEGAHMRFGKTLNCHHISCMVERYSISCIACRVSVVVACL